MLSGETANGSFPDTAVSIMSAIVVNAERGIDKPDVYNFIRNWTPKPMSLKETITSSAIQASFDMRAALIVVITNDARTASLISKWKPISPVIVVTTSKSLTKACNSRYGLHPLLMDEIPPMQETMQSVVKFAKERQLAKFENKEFENGQIVVVSGRNMTLTGTLLQITTYLFGEEAKNLETTTGYEGKHTFTFKSTKIGLDLVCEPIFTVRKTKIVCTMGPACWSEEAI
eukprot:345992-Hanusia_phi.AAC.1